MFQSVLVIEPISLSSSYFSRMTMSL